MRTNLKTISSLFILICLYSAILFCDESSSNYIIKRSFSNVQWEVHSDGSDPSIKAWDVEITLDDDQKLYTSHYEQKQISNPKEYFSTGTKFSILKESYLFNDPKQSWFLLKDQYGTELIMKGPAKQQKPSFETNDHVAQLFRVSFEKIDETGFIKFCISNEIADETYHVEVNSDKFTDYYEGMPILILNKNEEVNQWGQIRYHLTLYNPLTQREISTISDWIGGIVKKQKVTHVINDQNIVIAWHGDGDDPYLSTWNLSITVEDGSTFSKFHDYRTTYTQIINGRIYTREGLKFRWTGSGYTTGIDHDLYSDNDQIEIVSESPKGNGQSDFLIRNLSKNKEYLLTGTTRFKKKQ